jgi:hypothetical protein
MNFILLVTVVLLAILSYAAGHTVGFKEGKVTMLHQFRFHIGIHSEWSVEQIAEYEEAVMQGRLPRGF